MSTRQITLLLSSNSWKLILDELSRKREREGGREREGEGKFEESETTLP